MLAYIFCLTTNSLQKITYVLACADLSLTFFGHEMLNICQDETMQEFTRVCVNITDAYSVLLMSLVKYTNVGVWRNVIFYSDQTCFMERNKRVWIRINCLNISN